MPKTVRRRRAQQTTELGATAITAEETAAPDPSPTAGEPSTPLAAFVREVADSISEFEIIQGASGTEDTALGETLVLRLCAIPGSGIQ